MIYLIIIICISAIIFMYLLITSCQLPQNYLKYGEINYKLIPGTVYKFTEQQYKNNEFLTYKIMDPNIMAIIIYKKNNYKCIGLIGERQIAAYTKDKNINTISLSKNNNCFPNGGLEPEYLVVIPKNDQLNTYFAAINYRPTNNMNEIYNYFVNYGK